MYISSKKPSETGMSLTPRDTHDKPTSDVLWRARLDPPDNHLAHERREQHQPEFDYGERTRRCPWMDPPL
jgi:hypothetical protein